jgi:hypothetical protein
MSEDSRLDSLLKQMAENHQPELPSPGLIWWRAQILRKQQEKDRIERPMIIMRWLAAAVCAAAALVLAAGNWKLLQSIASDTNGLLLTLGIVVIGISALLTVVLLRSLVSKA